MQTAASKHYYGWTIVAVGFFCNFMSVGTGFYAFNAFMEPLCQLRDWTRTDVNLALMIGTLFGFLGQFLYGTIVMRSGVRRLMIFGALVSGPSFICIARAEHLWQFYLFYTLVFIGNGAYGGIIAATAVSNWFVDKRGKALGISTAGISFSGAVLPLAAMFAIVHIGMENAALVLGLAVMLVIPLALLLIREFPEDMGMLPDGAPNIYPTCLSADEGPCEDKGSQGQSSLPRTRFISVWPLSLLLRTGAFWKIGFSFGMLMIGTVGVMSQLKPRFTDIGFSDMHAMGMMAAAAFIGTLGKYVWGALCDRFDPKRVIVLLALLNAAALSLGLCRNSTAALWLFIPFFGFAMGGMMSTYTVMVAAFFGRESFASVLRYISIFLMLQLLGYLIAGQSYDRTGDYDAAYMIFIGLDLAAAAMLTTLKRPTAA